MLKTRIAAAAAALFFSSAIVAPAQAATITYTLTGNFTGINGGPFTDVSAVFTGIGDTDDAYELDSTTTVVNLSSFSALAGGLTYTFNSPISYFVNRSENFSGFLTSDISTGFVRFFGSEGQFAGYDGVSNLVAGAATFYTDFNTGTFNTDRGDVLVTAASNLTFSASVAGVPEPATWGLMILGFGAVGGAMRRKAAVKASVRFV